MPFLLALLPVLAQIGAAPSLGLPMIDRPTKPNIRKQPIIILPTPAGPLQTCLDAAGENPAAGEKIARAWIARGDKESAASRAQGHLCLGTALANQDQWDNARLTFAAGMNIAMPDDHMLRAELGAMAGDAALTAGDAGQALALLDTAAGEAAPTGEAELTGTIALDRARAFVALKRTAEAAPALAQARRDLPKDAQVWLLSATLSRRLGDLVAAQGQIETAASLAPPRSDMAGDIGLEAGVIAMLAGHEDAARKSWQSVVNGTPGSAAATQAATYLQQIGAASPGTPPAPRPQTSAER